jgi:hypothetical protein
MRIVVQLKSGTAPGRPSRARGARPVLPWLDRALTPMHAGTTDPTLASFYEIEVDDPAEADRLIGRLLNDPSIDAAYVKPDDELPSM